MAEDVLDDLQNQIELLGDRSLCGVAPFVGKFSLQEFEARAPVPLRCVRQMLDRVAGCEAFRGDHSGGE